MRIPDQTCSEYLISATLHIMVAKKSLVRHQAFDCIRTTIEPRTVSNSAVWEEGYFWIVFYLSQNLSSNSSDFFIHIEHKFLAQSLTMAEVLGTIASGVSIAQLAGNLASSIIKFKSYWDQIQDAPDDIAFLVCEIESHHTILRSILEKQAQLTSSCHPTSGFFDQSIKLCHNASSELDGLVNALSKDINSNRKWKRTMGSANVLLKAEQLKKLKKRMKNATRSMHLATSWQMNTVLQQQSSTLTSNVQASLDTFLQHWQNRLLNSGLSQPTCSTKVSMDSAVLAQTTNITMEAKTRLPVDHNFYEQESSQTMSHYNLSSWVTFAFGSIGRQKFIKRNRKGASQTSEAVYRLPAWISNRAWQYMYIKDSLSLGWKIEVQTYRTLNTNSDFFDYLFNCDIPNGATPLHIAVFCGHEDLCKLLLLAGADVSAVDHDQGSTPLQWIAKRAAVTKYDLKKDPLESIRILVESGAEEEILGDSRIFESTTGDVNVSNYIQRHTFLKEPLFPEKCLIAARKLLQRSNWSHEPNVVRSFLGGPNFPSNVKMHKSDPGLMDVFEILCERYATAKSSVLKSRFASDCGDRVLDPKPWEILIREMVVAKIPLNYMSSSYHTPLQGLLKEFFIGIEIRHLERELLYWLEILMSCDVDLEQYGKKVMFLFNLIKSKDLKWPYMVSLLPRARFEPEWRGTWTEIHIIRFTYDHHLEDWKFWFSEPTDRFAGEFWSLVEDPPLATFIPGAWVEEYPDI